MINQIKDFSGGNIPISTEKGSVEAVRSILVIELMNGDWEKAEKTYSALRILVNKEIAT